MTKEYQTKVMMSSAKDTTRILKEESFTYCVFTKDILEIKKSVDQEEDYYFPGDQITFTLLLKNVGVKNLRNFTIKDDSISKLEPLEDGYFDVNSPKGEVNFLDDEVEISGITLAPNEEMTITISGVVKEEEEVTSEDTPEDF